MHWQCSTAAAYSVWQFHFCSSACFSFHPHSPTETLTFASVMPNPLYPLWARAVELTPTVAVHTLHPASCDDDTDVTVLFLCRIELTAQGGNLLLVHASFFTQYLSSSTLLSLLFRSISPYFFFLKNDVPNLIHRSTLSAASLIKQLQWLEPHPNAAVY